LQGHGVAKDEQRAFALNAEAAIHLRDYDKTWI
jgi:hypothetical protein